MKKNLLTLIGGLVLASSVAIAQPTLTSSGINPILGDNFTYYSTLYINPGLPGAGQTWDLSSLVGTANGITNVVLPSATVNGSSFLSSDVAAQNTASSTDSYYKTTSAVLQNSGISAGGTNITYTNFEDMMHYPFTYLNTFTDPWAAEFFTASQYWRTGSTTVTADGYGTLITPVGTYTNVTRVHFVQTYQDSTFIGSPFIITYNNDEYFWYKDGFHLPMAAIYTLTTSAGGPYTGGYYTDQLVGINKAPSFISSSNVFPNPAVNDVTLHFTLTESKEVEVHLYNSLGQQMDVVQHMKGFIGSNTMNLNIESLAEGIYFAQLKVEGNTAITKRFVVNK